jgi:hypothetical protein
LGWAGRELAPCPASQWRDRYALANATNQLAVLEGHGWGRRPVTLTIDDPARVEPELLLLAAFVVRGLAEDGSGDVGRGGSSCDRRLIDLGEPRTQA